MSIRSTPGRALVLLPPIAADDSLKKLPVIIEVGGAGVRNLLCPGLASDDQLCGRQDGHRVEDHLPADAEHRRARPARPDQLLNALGSGGARRRWPTMATWATVTTRRHTGRASRTRRRSGARRRRRRLDHSARSGCSTTTGRRSTAGTPAARSTPASTPSTGTWCTAGRPARAALRLARHRHARGPSRMPSCSTASPVRRSAAHPRGREGDRVVIYMPMVPEAVIAMLACARIGAVHSVVFGGFAPAELAARIEDAQAGGRRRRLLRHRAHPGDGVQADARRRDRPRRAQARVTSWCCSARRPARRSGSATPTGTS